MHRHVYEVLQQLYALRLEVQHGNCQKSLELCVCLPALLAKPEQRRGATGGTNPGPARNFTCQHTARYRSLGEKREGRAVPKTAEHLSAALVGLAHAMPYSRAQRAPSLGHSLFLRKLPEHQQRMDAHSQDFSWVWGCSDLLPKDGVCLPAVSCLEGKEGNLLPLQLPTVPRGSKRIRLLLLLRLPVIDSHCFAKSSSASRSFSLCFYSS